MGAGVVAYVWPAAMSFSEADEAHADGRLSGDWPMEQSWRLGLGTNNRAELLAINLGLGLLEDPARTGVTVLTDSEYARGALAKAGAPSCNHDLIAVTKSLTAQCAYCRIEWVRGHDRCVGNIRADALAEEATILRPAVRRSRKRRPSQPTILPHP